MDPGDRHIPVIAESINSWSQAFHSFFHSLRLAFRRPELHASFVSCPRIGGSSRYQALTEEFEEFEWWGE